MEKVKSELELNDLNNKYEEDKKHLWAIINSGKYTKSHVEKLSSFIYAINTIKNINIKYLKNKLSVEEYIMELNKTLTDVVKE